MKVKFNNTEVETSAQTVLAFLAEQGMENKTGIAVALNSSIVSKSNWSTQNIQEQDSIMVITATAGG
ncbi:sulfur carrier protein ThiS [Lishizhenia tianjinensis]|uniref:Sulfur carrier protein ThiS n=1 Tax=Lishizhenia tianjinensis TaxID=477690 RepID=A0A1I7B0K5_9FLAO|nr:sulfur carrier protein ThiS [Lishizhenia tianjinensis]SFT80725.1 sulfur carrier protein ThiS [Lishizhenia tianjinensis]